MTAEQFVDAIQKVVLEASVKDTVAVLERPPGRSPSRELLELSAWFNGLGASDREMVQRTFKEVAHAAVFGFLVVLDGSRAVTSDRGPRHFELRYV
ncbi:MAG TPA: hypothetical protein VIV58_18145, partial [Kofleriaceae bacterium]